MTQPPPPEPAPPAEPGASVLEWGGSRWPEQPGPPRWRDQRISWALAGLGAVALFASMIGEWTVTVLAWGGDEPERAVTRMANSGAWGAGWAVGGLALAVTAGVALFGPAGLRSAGLRSGARAIGLATAGAMLGFLVAICVDLNQTGFQYPYAWPEEVQVDITLERGLLVGYPALALLAAALWLARPATGNPAAAQDVAAHDQAVPFRPGSQPASPPGSPPVRPLPAGSGDLTVGPAEPFTGPTDDHEWR